MNPQCYFIIWGGFVYTFLGFNELLVKLSWWFLLIEQAQDITDLGSLKEAAKIFVPGI